MFTFQTFRQTLLKRSTVALDPMPGSQMSMDEFIKILRALYEVKNLILSTGAPFQPEIPTYKGIVSILWNTSPLIVYSSIVVNNHATFSKSRKSI